MFKIGRKIYGHKKLFKKNKVGKTAKIQNKHNMWNKLVKGIELVRKWLMECLKHLSSISILGVAALLSTLCDHQLFLEVFGKINACVHISVLPWMIKSLLGGKNP